MFKKLLKKIPYKFFIIGMPITIILIILISTFLIVGLTRINDGGQYFDRGDQKEISSMMSDVRNKYGCDIFLVTHNGFLPKQTQNVYDMIISGSSDYIFISMGPNSVELQTAGIGDMIIESELHHRYIVSTQDRILVAKSLLNDIDKEFSTIKHARLKGLWKEFININAFKIIVCILISLTAVLCLFHFKKKKKVEEEFHILVNENGERYFEIYKKEDVLLDSRRDVVPGFYAGK